ncbi:MAG: hypothetical protein AB2747_05420 [Candidatus Thiodiazotropha taylori]
MTEAKATQNDATEDLVEVVIDVEEGHTYAGEEYKKGDKLKVTPYRREKLKERRIIK